MASVAVTMTRGSASASLPRPVVGSELASRAKPRLPRASTRAAPRASSESQPSSSVADYPKRQRAGGCSRRGALALPIAAAAASALPAPALADGAAARQAAPSFEALPGGLRVLKLRDGGGQVAEQGDVVEINFTGRLASKQGWFFENTYNNKGPDGFPVPFEFRVGDGTVIAGLDEAVRQMRKGEILRAVIPPQLSYQNKSQGPVPREWSNKRRLYSTVLNEVRLANGEGDTLATVVLDIELMSIRKP